MGFTALTLATAAKFNYISCACHTHAHTYAHSLARTHHARAHIRTHVHTLTHTRTRVHAHTHERRIRAHTHAHTHAHIINLFSEWPLCQKGITAGGLQAGIKQFFVHTAPLRALQPDPISDGHYKNRNCKTIFLAQYTFTSCLWPGRLDM